MKIEFGDPSLRRVKRVSQYELDGVAFIEGFTPINFTFWYTGAGDLRLRMDALEQSMKLYGFFKKLFGVSLAPMQGGLGSLHVELKFEVKKKEALLQRIEKDMGVEWRKAFDRILSVYETSAS